MVRSFSNENSSMDFIFPHFSLFAFISHIWYYLIFLFVYLIVNGKMQTHGFHILRGLLLAYFHDDYIHDD